MEKIRGLIFTEEEKFTPGEVDCENGKIIGVTELTPDDLTAEERESLIIPGLVDIHSHGCYGHDTCDADADGLRAMIKFEESQGITSYVPTTMTFHEDRLTEVVKVIKEVARETKTIKGIYLEGPFISKKKCGAQNPEYIMKPDARMVERLNRASGSLVKIVAIAPEVEGAKEFIQECSKEYCLSIAHTDSDYDTAKTAMDAGAKHVTHFFNAMPPYTHRAPGVIGAAMDSDDVKVELIADGIHIAPAVVRNTFKQFGADRVILISDSMEATGMPDGKYSLGGQDVFVDGRLATLKSGTIAGSASTLFDCVREAVKMGVPKEKALVSATKTPAKEIGIYDRAGSLTVGKDADIVICDLNLNVKKVIL